MRNSDIFAEKDLLWYFNCSQSACGIKSNWGAMIAMANGAGGQWHDNFDDRIAKNVDRGRTIEKTFRSLPEYLQMILYARYCDNNYPPQIKASLGVLSGPALLIAADKARLLKVCTKLKTEDDKNYLSEVRDAARKLLTRAITEYSDRRSNVKR